MPSTIKIHTDAEQVLGYLRELAEAVAESPQDIMRCVPGLPKSIPEFTQLVLIENDEIITTGAPEPIVRFKPTDRLIEIMSALRTFKSERGIG